MLLPWKEEVMSFEAASMSFGYCEGDDPALAAPRKKENFFVFVVGTLQGVDFETIAHRVEWYKSTHNDHQTIEVSEENGASLSSFVVHDFTICGLVREK